MQHSRVVKAGDYKTLAVKDYAVYLDLISLISYWINSVDLITTAS